MKYISQKLIKPRKPHPCRVCGTEISISEQCISYTGVYGAAKMADEMMAERAKHLLFVHAQENQQ